MKTNLLPLFLCVLFIGACGSVPGTPIASPSSTPIPTQTALLDPLSTLTPTPVVWPTDFSPVLYGGKLYEKPFFILLGGVSGDVWLAPDLSVARYAGGATYSLHTLTQKDKYFIWGEAPDFSPTCQNYFVGTDAGLEEAGFVAVFDGWTVTKRDVIELSADEEIYRQALIDWLEGEGIASPEIGTMRIFRVDLEGDGADEVFINAAHLDDSQHTTQAGDYSIILMRKVVGNDVLTTQILGDVYKSRDLEITFPRTYSIANFIDLNQDGVLEVLVDIRGWEKFGAIVYQIDEEDVIQTLRAEC
jgi:hypothetical protein